MLATAEDLASNGIALPPKSELSKELRNLATTLSPEMQKAAIGKARELNFDLTKGRLTLQETLINLSRNRDAILDLVNDDKLKEIPLQVQYLLYGQIQKIQGALRSCRRAATLREGRRD